MPEQAVKLHIYDLSHGLARTHSETLLGRQIEGVWHTGVVIGDTEYYYGHGIHATRAGRTIAGSPDRVLELGNTSLAAEVAESYLVALSEGRFAPSAYNVVHNNCNNFADEFARFLTGNGVPDYVLNLPNEVASTPYGQTLLSFLATFETAAAAHDAEQPTEPTRQPRPAPQPREEGPSCRPRRRCGPMPPAFGLPPFFMMMQGPFGGGPWDGCGPCGPAACGGGPRSARRGCPQRTPAPANTKQAADKPSTSRQPPPEPEGPAADHDNPFAEGDNPFAACLADLIDVVRGAGRDDLLDNVLAEHHAVLDSLHQDGGDGEEGKQVDKEEEDVDMHEAPKKAEEDSFEVVQ